MRPSILPDLIRPQINLAKIRTFVEKYWFRMAILGLCIYTLLVKDINLQLTMNAAKQEQEAVIPADFWEKEVFPPLESETAASQAGTAVEMSVVPDLAAANGLTAKPQIAKAVPTSSKKKAKSTANNFSNLTFILSPTYAKRHQISPDIVRAKERKCSHYVQRFAPVAVSEMKKFGIPASITLAQALLESNVGESRLTRANKNHFGIKCFSQKCRKGHCSNFTDDTHKDFFRVYQSAWDSYRAHSDFLQGQRYIHLKKLGTKAYREWAHGLKKAGYATDEKYAEKLIKIIETLKLYKYDQ